MNLYKKIFDHSRNDSSLAIVDGLLEISYIELNNQIHECRVQLENQGIGKGFAVLFEMENSSDFLIIFLALQACGACAVPIDPALEPGEKSKIRDYMKVKQVGVWKNYELQFGKQSIFEDQGMVQMSSGSTGDPKGIVISQRALVSRACAIAKHLELNSQDKTLIAVPLAHSHGIDCLAMPTLIGRGTVVLKKMKLAGPVQVLKAIDKFKITFFSSIPNFYQFLLEIDPSKSFDLTSLRHPFCGSAALDPRIPPQLKKRYGIDLKQGYGVAEIGVICLNNHDARHPLNYQSVGEVIEGVEIELKESGKGEEYELLVKGESMYSGYIEDLEQNKPVGQIQTGDLVQRDPFGRFYITGRISDFMNIRGVKVYPLEIENALLEDEAIDEVAVCKRVDESKEDYPIAYVKLRYDISLKELKKRVRDKLGSAKTPRDFVPIDQFPKSPLGKILKSKLS